MPNIFAFEGYRLSLRIRSKPVNRFAKYQRTDRTRMLRSRAGTVRRNRNVVTVFIGYRFQDFESYSHSNTFPTTDVQDLPRDETCVV